MFNNNKKKLLKNDKKFFFTNPVPLRKREFFLMAKEDHFKF